MNFKILIGIGIVLLLVTTAVASEVKYDWVRIASDRAVRIAYLEAVITDLEYQLENQESTCNCDVNIVKEIQTQIIDPRSGYNKADLNLDGLVNTGDMDIIDTCWLLYCEGKTEHPFCIWD